MKKKEWKASAVTDAQALAIGHMTINFNSMEQAVASFISLVVSPRDLGLDKPLIPRSLNDKLKILRKLVESLSRHYVPTPKNDAAYSRFASDTKALISRAQKLNSFRNDMIHWHYDKGVEQVKVEVSAEEIEARSSEMKGIAAEIMARAAGMRTGDYSLSFGQQFAKSE